MTALTDVSEQEFEEALGPGDVRGFQIFQGALVAGTVLFGIVVGVFSATGILNPPQAGEGLDEVLPVVSLVHAVVAATCWILGFVLYNLAFSPSRLRALAERPMVEGPRLEPTWGPLPAVFEPFRQALERQRKTIEHPAAKCVAAIRGAEILRLAMLEGPALFGLVICLLGVISDAPAYWLNSLSAVAFVIFGLVTFPTRDRLLDVFRMKIQGARGLA